MTSTETRNRTLGAALDGSRGTVVFGSGIAALIGDISHTGDDDYIIVEGYVSGTTPPLDENDDIIPRVFAVPLASIAYFRWND